MNGELRIENSMGLRDRLNNSHFSIYSISIFTRTYFAGTTAKGAILFDTPSFLCPHETFSLYIPNTAHRMSPRHGELGVAGRAMVYAEQVGFHKSRAILLHQPGLLAAEQTCSRSGQRPCGLNVFDFLLHKYIG
jgi:hypothetical protein